MRSRWGFAARALTIAAGRTTVTTARAATSRSSFFMFLAFTLGSRRSILFGHEQVQSQPPGEEPGRQLSPDAVSGGVERRSGGPEPSLPGETVTIPRPM